MTFWCVFPRVLCEIETRKTQIIIDHTIARQCMCFKLDIRLDTPAPQGITIRDLR